MYHELRKRGTRMPATSAKPVSRAEANELFADLVSAPAIVLAVSGGPDSTALLLLAARWRQARRRGPKLLAVTVDHGLRAGSAAEAKQVARLARSLGVPHRILRWTGAKPRSGLQEKARMERYRLLSEAAVNTGASHILTAHTLDDQAETVLMRLLRGSGPTGLSGMSARDAARGADVDKARVSRFRKRGLIATLRQAKIPFIDDPSNRDPRFTRVRMRELMPALGERGARRQAVGRCWRGDYGVPRRRWRQPSKRQAKLARGNLGRRSAAIEMAGAAFRALPAEVALRLLGRAVAMAGNEGPVELAKLEALHAAIIAKTAQKGGGFAALWPGRWSQ